MKYLRRFESFSEFDLGRFSEEEEINKPVMADESEEECEPCGDDEDDYVFSSEEEEDYATEPHRIRRWGDEDIENLDEKKKLNAGLKAYLDKQKGKKSEKNDKEEKSNKGAKPDFLDLDKDGDKKEPMKKAAKEAKEKKEEKGGKGLTAAQKKLPEGLRKAIEAKNKKR